MDPMTELFYDESNTILQELRKGMVTCKGMSVYGQDIVQSVFRCVHTLKASSTMMMFENLSQLSKSLEQMLFCFRGEGKEIAETQRFDDILVSYVDFFERETDQLTLGKTPEERADDLAEKIKAYTEELTGSMEEDEIEAYRQHYSTQPKRQIYYIAGDTEGDGAETSSEPEKGKKEDAIQMAAEPDKEDGIRAEKKEEDDGSHASQKVPACESGTAGSPSDDKAPCAAKEQENSMATFGKGSDNSPKRYVISENKREMLFRGIRNLQRMVNSLEYSVTEEGTGEITLEQLEKLRDIERDLVQVKKYLTKADFVPVAKKMEIVVEEMSMKLGKRVRLLVKGEHTPIDFEMREKISNALIHIIRNAMDHGIEDMDERERMGKAPVGLIKLKFAIENGALRISVKDDGRGIDTNAILRKAEEQGMLEKPASEYTRDEAYALMLKSGVTTTEIPNDYSGRGVGMDVIAHTVEELGGKLKITSQFDEGTTITMKF
ncbi:MAG: hypothetical protein HFH62_13430 [Lachnospiraceae bacterium]|nr:hypothetical protein [Lachnospiraceae bacterium]